MATGGYLDEEQTSDELRKSLSISVIRYCDPCQDDETDIEAEGFRVDCNEFLCSGCYIAHRRARPSRDHVLQDKSSMPVDKQSVFTATERCPIHKDETTKWYCESHDATLCDLCKSTQHRKCEGIKTLNDVSKDIFNSTKYTSIKESLTKLKNKIENQINGVKKNAAEVDRTYDANLREITNLFTEIRDKDRQLMASLEVTCNASLSTVASLISDLETSEANGRNEQAFVTQLKVETQIKAIEHVIESVNEDNQITKYRFR